LNNYNKRPEGLLTPFPNIPIEEKKPIVYNEVTRRTEMAHSSGKYARMKHGKSDPVRKYVKMQKAFEATFDYLGDGWFERDTKGRLRHERR
jgi:hypothetical protein|tara:strand:+ start:790 stop:1062 length:273 start_codon:yes stop_codon:yes gene_type:complete